MSVLVKRYPGGQDEVSSLSSVAADLVVLNFAPLVSSFKVLSGDIGRVDDLIVEDDDELGEVKEIVAVVKLGVPVPFFSSLRESAEGDDVRSNEVIISDMEFAIMVEVEKVDVCEEVVG